MDPEEITTSADLLRLQQEKLREREVPIVATKAVDRTFQPGDFNVEESTRRLVEAGRKAKEIREKENLANAENLKLEAVRVAAAKHRLKLIHLREEWNAPIRCVDFHKGLNFSETNNHPWWKAYVNTRAKLNSGFTRALVGARRTGKTQLGTELMFNVTDLEEPALYTTTLWFLIQLRSTYRKDSPLSEEQVIRKYTAPKLLVLDEFGKRGETDWENNMLFQLLDQRHQDMTDTLILSNEDKDQFQEAVGPSLARRIDDTGGIIDTSGWPRFAEQRQP